MNRAAISRVCVAAVLGLVLAPASAFAQSPKEKARQSERILEVVAVDQWAPSTDVVRSRGATALYVKRQSSAGGDLLLVQRVGLTPDALANVIAQAGLLRARLGDDAPSTTVVPLNATNRAFSARGPNLAHAAAVIGHLQRSPSRQIPGFATGSTHRMPQGRVR